MDGDVVNAAEKTYRAIGRVIFEFSQVEYTIRHHDGEELNLKDEYFTMIVEILDVSQLIALAKELFTHAEPRHNVKEITRLLERFRINLYHTRKPRRNLRLLRV